MPVDPADYRPTLADLGGVMRARTRDSDGNELGTFTADTSPTDDEADGVITTALALVAARLGQVPDALGDLARSLVVLRAAMLVETSYVPEETSTDTSAYAAYREQYRDALADYDAATDRDVGEAQVRLASVGMKSATALAAEAAQT